MKIAIAADHAGFALKEKLRDRLASDGHQVVDFGSNSAESCDYPDFAQPVAREVAQGRFDRGTLVCSTGIGMAMAANKVAGVRAAPVRSADEARLTREHNDTNILTLGARGLRPKSRILSRPEVRRTPPSAVDLLVGLFVLAARKSLGRTGRGRPARARGPALQRKHNRHSLCRTTLGILMSRRPWN